MARAHGAASSRMPSATSATSSTRLHRSIVASALESPVHRPSGISRNRIRVRPSAGDEQQSPAAVGDAWSQRMEPGPSNSAQWRATQDERWRLDQRSPLKAFEKDSRCASIRLERAFVTTSEHAITDRATRRKAGAGLKRGGQFRFSRIRLRATSTRPSTSCADQAATTPSRLDDYFIANGAWIVRHRHTAAPRRIRSRRPERFAFSKPTMSRGDGDRRPIALAFEQAFVN